MEAAAYRARRPAQTPLYALLESLHETVKGAWEDLFERRFGFRRGVLDGVVARYLDCGIPERGFARVRCPGCAAEYLLAFSCEGRGLCPSCGARRAAEFAAFLKDDAVAGESLEGAAVAGGGSGSHPRPMAGRRLRTRRDVARGIDRGSPGAVRARLVHLPRRRRDSNFLSRHGETMGTFDPSRFELRGSAPRSARLR